LTPVTSSRIAIQLAKLFQIKRQSRARSFALQEDDKQTIVDIFDAVEDARNLLMVRMLAANRQNDKLILS
jgi:hypothetical protein